MENAHFLLLFDLISKRGGRREQLPRGVFFKESFLEDPWRYLIRREHSGEPSTMGLATNVQEQTKPKVPFAGEEGKPIEEEEDDNEEEDGQGKASSTQSSAEAPVCLSEPNEL